MVWPFGNASTCCIVVLYYDRLFVVTFSMLRACSDYTTCYTWIVRRSTNMYLNAFAHSSPSYATYITHPHIVARCVACRMGMERNGGAVWNDGAWTSRVYYVKTYNVQCARTHSSLMYHHRRDSNSFFYVVLVFFIFVLSSCLVFYFLRFTFLHNCVSHFVARSLLVDTLSTCLFISTDIFIYFTQNSLGYSTSASSQQFWSLFGEYASV